MANSIVLDVYGLLTIIPIVVCSRDVCEVNGSYYYCDDGYYCCENDTSCCYRGSAPGLVAGIIIAAIFGMLFISAIIYVAVTKYKKRRRRVVQPIQTISVNTIHQNNSFQYTSQPPQPPAYSQHDTSSIHPPCQPGGSNGIRRAEPPKYASGFYPTEQPPPYSDIYRGSSEPPSYIGTLFDASEKLTGRDHLNK